MSELKTQKNDASVESFLNSIEDQRKREDSYKLLEIMKDVTGEPATMWGTSIVGFGSYRYKNAAGKENEWFVTGFSPRKQALTLYIMSGFEDYDSLLGDLGKHSTGKACLYVKKLDDVDMDVLRDLVQKSVDHMQASNT